MAIPKFFQFGKSYSGGTIDLSSETGKDDIDASQTSNATIDLGSGATNLTAGDFDTVYAGSGTDFVYSARGTTLVTGSGSDTFVYGVGSKPQAPGMIGACVVGDFARQDETIEISKSFFGSNTKQQMANLASAIAGMNSDAGYDPQTGTRTLTIDKAGDSITFLSGQAIDPHQIKLV